jgi:hypothetical protein
MLLAEFAEQSGALCRRQLQQDADVAPHRRVAGGAASPASPARRARLALGLCARAHVSDFRAAIMRAARIFGPRRAGAALRAPAGATAGGME